MSTSRRTFLKRTIAGASVALGEFQSLAVSAGKSAGTAAPLSSPSTPQSGAAPSAEAPAYTRGLGVYPGNPQEDFSPTLVIDGSTYRNLALRRPAYHSSSYDYNLTAQLITDGIKDSHLPRWVATSADFRGQLPKNEREFLLDHNPITTLKLSSPRASVQVHLAGGERVPEVDRLDVLAIALTDESRPESLSFTVSVSGDGRDWKEAGHVDNPEPAPVTGYPVDFAKMGQLYEPSIPLSTVSRSRFYRIEFNSANVSEWRIGEVAFFHQNRRVEIGGPDSFTSAWMGGGLGQEWVYVDLGARCEFDRVVLYWIERAAEGSVQVSDDARNWRDIQALPSGTGLTDEMKLTPPVQGRYVRVLMKRPTSPYGYILSEIEIYGRGGPVAQPKAAPAARGDGRLDLAGGAWRLQRASLVDAEGAALSQVGFQDNDWAVATVPGTVLASYLNVGAIPDPNYGDNQLQISDSFFQADFWYRNEFVAPPLAKRDRAWLNFDGVNWKADIFLNGEKVGRMEGAFIRGRFDVTDRLLPGQQNALAVRVKKNATPGSTKQKTFDSPGKNGGALGLDNPTFHGSVGWDWIPTIRGRDTGLWNAVYLNVTGPVTLEDPFVTTALPLPDVSRADVTIEVNLLNHESKPVAGILRARFGELELIERVTIEGSARSKVKLDPSSHPALRLENPKLWWPAGYGEPYLYKLELSFEPRRRKVSDTKTLQVGIRQMSYSEEGGTLRIWINGRRFVARGGNWGFSESLLRYRAREFDAAVRYHRDMNFTMIRNWVGQTGQDEFYEACDRHGIMVWQDFWLANPADGPDPKDNDMFLRNVQDMVLRVRNHPSIGLYCGRNEGYPPKPLEEGIREVLAKIHPGVHYISSSADDVVTGHGPYQAMPRSYYFAHRATEKLHSEMGLPNIPTSESVRALLPEASRWPQGLEWGLHDFCLEGAQGGDSFRNMIDFNYGGAKTLEEWVSLAQFINYDGYRAMFEAQSKNRMGLLIWMSHACWPSFVWQTYDYYFDPSAAYFGCKKACEPLHIQWNPHTESIEVVNYSAGNRRGLTASVEVLNMDGAKTWGKSAPLDSAEDSVTPCIKMEYPAALTAVHFLRLSLSEGGNIISRNFYLRPLQEGDYRAIRELPKVELEARTRAERRGNRWQMTTEVRNLSNPPALMVRLKVVRENSQDRILPALYSDNYIALMPGERQMILTEFEDADARGEKPRLVLEGFNVGKVTEV